VRVSQEIGEQHRKGSFEAVVWIYRRLQRRDAPREIGPPTSARPWDRVHTGHNASRVWQWSTDSISSEERNVGW
jgi:hypothetical protein